MDWHTYYRITCSWSLWIERDGCRWQLHLAPKDGGNYWIGTVATPEDCSRMLDGGNKFPEGWIRVGFAAV